MLSGNVSGDARNVSDLLENLILKIPMLVNDATCSLSN